jgi:hypothetical protein
MDDSRLVHQPPAETSDSGQIQHLPCRVCGKNNWDTITRQGVEIDLRTLLPYQEVSCGPAFESYSLHTCKSCALADHEERARAIARESVSAAASPLPGDAFAKAERDYLLARLLFASRELALSRFTRASAFRTDDAMCADCRLVQASDARLTHTVECPTGRVLGLLDGLMNVPPVSNFSNLERRPCEEISTEPEQAARETVPPAAAQDYGEPWRVSFGGELLLRSDGRVVVDMYGSEIIDEDDEVYAKRIAACINACVGVSTMLLENSPARLFEDLLRARQQGGAR